MRYRPFEALSEKALMGLELNGFQRAARRCGYEEVPIRVLFKDTDYRSDGDGIGHLGFARYASIGVASGQVTWEKVAMALDLGELWVSSPDGGGKDGKGDYTRKVYQWKLGMSPRPTGYNPPPITTEQRDLHYFEVMKEELARGGDWRPVGDILPNGHSMQWQDKPSEPIKRRFGIDEDDG